MASNKNILIIVFLFIGMVGHNTVLYAQQVSNRDVSFYYAANKTLFIENKKNSESLNQMDYMLLHPGITKISINAYASPDGVMNLNHQLCDERAADVRSYIEANYTINSATIIRTERKGVDWEGLYKRVKEDTNTPQREVVLSVLQYARNNDELKDYFSYRLSLMTLGDSVWRYLSLNHFPYLRRADITISSTFSQQELPSETKEISVWNDIHALSDARINSDSFCLETEIGTDLNRMKDRRVVRPLAVKTNLLFDIVSLVNVEIEVPITSRWSVAGEWMFPWWINQNKQRCLQILAGHVEGRYWISPDYRNQNRALLRHNPLTGYFIGMYIGTGMYDVEWNKKGYQGDFFTSTGISAGYVKSLNRSFSMEFSLGLGYFQTNYWHYKAIYDTPNDKWCLMRQNKDSFSWIGPTRAKVSLIWYPQFYKKKKD